jgi:hypothetical protein
VSDPNNPSNTGGLPGGAPEPAAPAPTRSTASTRLQPNPPSFGSRVFGCLGRVFSALLVIVITSGLTLGALAYVALSLGYTAQTPAVLQSAQERVATLEVENGVLRAENVAVQTQLAGMLRQAGSDREQVDGLNEQVSGFTNISNEVATRLAADSRERATVASEMRQSRDSVQLFATTEAGRATQIDDLQRRSDRIERFLFRLSDIANDAATDISDATPTPAAPLADTPTPAPILTDTPTPTVIPTPSATPTPELVASPTPRTTPTPTRRP